MGVIESGGLNLRDLSVMPSRTGGAAHQVAPGSGLSTTEAAERTGATQRQVDWWIRHGLLGDGFMPGIGSRRRFGGRHLEVLHALVQLAALGCDTERMAVAAGALRAAPVRPDGERLVLLLDGTCYRHPVGEPVRAGGPLWMVPLRSFAVEVSSDA